MSQEDWDKASAAALALFEFGQAEAAKRGLLLVDTKYEFGKDASGTIYLIDEIHTPDSSRYWLARSYAQRHAEGKVGRTIRRRLRSCIGVLRQGLQGASGVPACCRLGPWTVSLVSILYSLFVSMSLVVQVHTSYPEPSA